MRALLTRDEVLDLTGDLAVEHAEEIAKGDLSKCESKTRKWLLDFEIAELFGRSPGWVRNNAYKFITGREKSTGGRPRLVYDVASLPPEQQRQWSEKLKQKVVEILPAATSAPGQLSLALTAPAGPNMSPEDRAEAERRYRVIEPLVVREKFQATWIAHGNQKAVLVAWLAQQHRTAPRTVYHWLKAWKAGGLPALVAKTRADKGRPRVFNSAALDFILAASLPRPGMYGALSVREVYRAYAEERAWRTAHAGKVMGEFERRKYARYVDESGRLADTAQLPEASYETFRAWVAKIPDPVKVMAREGEEAFHNTQEIISFRDLAEIKPLEYVVMDHRRLDLFCLSKSGQGWKLIRPWLTAAIDMRTRKWVGYSIVETPSSDSIASVLKRVFLDWGIPTSLYWDNGKDFRCEWLEGRQRKQGESYRVGEFAPATRGVLETLGVRVHHAIVKRARAKIIEPNFGNTANFDKTLPEYCGHKPDARPERLEKLVEQHERWTRGEAQATPFRTIEVIAGLYGEFLESLNEREHSGEGMRKVTPTGHGWMCPNEAWEMGTRGMEIRKAAPEVLQFCFYKRRELTVRNGEIRPSFHGRPYHYRLADNRLALTSLNGREVEFAYDPHDLGTAALYCDGAFLGLAHNVELRRMGEDAFVQDERDRRAVRREVKKLIETVHRAIPVASPEERATRRLAVKPARIPHEGMEGTMSGPPSIMAAVEAQREEKGFRFAEADAAMIRAADAAAYRDDDPDDEFQFFQEG